jgi:Flp pilus assembly protein TadG
MNRAIEAVSPEAGPHRDGGQIIVIFALSLVALVAMVGLVLDGGSAFAQRRDEQAAADLAALAAANDYLINRDQAAAVARGRAVAAQNGFTHGTDGATVDVTITTTSGAEITVDVSAPHDNHFATIVGMPTWQVSTTASALAGFPDTAVGAAPFIFNVEAFEDPGGAPKALYSNPANPYHFGETNNDAPDTPGDLAWTNYGTGNVNTNEVRRIIDGSLVIDKTLAKGEYIGQHNNGHHTALYSDVNTHLAGRDLPVPIVDDNGLFQGWAIFHVVSATGGSAKEIVGYFVSDFQAPGLTIEGCSFTNCPRYFGAYVLELSN